MRHHPFDSRVALISILLATCLTLLSYLRIELGLYTAQDYTHGVASSTKRGAASNMDRFVNDGPPRPLVHVFSPHVKESSTHNFYPLGLEQWIMLASVHNAKVAYNRRIQQGNVTSPLAFDSVMTVCPIFEHDRELLNQILSFYCDHVRVLSRSTATEYNLEKHIPFLQDIFDAGSSVVDGEDGEYYLMYSNADISASDDLFGYVDEQLRKHNAEALNILRRTIPPEHIPALMLLETQDIDGLEEKHQAVMLAVGQSRSALRSGLSIQHPGHDCFVIHSSLLKMFNLGDMFIGFPPWSNAFAHWVLAVVATKVSKVNHQCLAL